MSAVVETAASNLTSWYENGERVYPCHCGKTHRGPYAVYDFGHHNCSHPSPLVLDQHLRGLAFCGHCGQQWRLASHAGEVAPEEGEQP